MPVPSPSTLRSLCHVTGSASLLSPDALCPSGLNPCPSLASCLPPHFLMPWQSFLRSPPDQHLLLILVSGSAPGTAPNKEPATGDICLTCSTRPQM